MTARSGSTMRYQTTVSTLIGTLSRVMRFLLLDRGRHRAQVDLVCHSIRNQTM